MILGKVLGSALIGWTCLCSFPPTSHCDQGWHALIGLFGSHALPVLPEDRVSPLISCVESEACMGSQSRMWKLLLDIVRGNSCLREISGNIICVCIYIYIYFFFFFFASAFPKFVQFSSVQSLSCVRLLAKYFFELLERNPKILRMKFGHKRGLALFQADNGFLCYPFQVWFPF